MVATRTDCLLSSLFSSSMIRVSTYSRVANTTAGSIFSVMLPVLATMKFIRTTCVRPEPCDSTGL
ncbi:hypothetical protein D3C84_1147880 [compost metagenome]